MELQVRNSEGNMFAIFKGQFAEDFSKRLLSDEKNFKKSIKKFVGSEEEYICFTAKDTTKINWGTENSKIEIWLDKNDYIKVQP